MNLQVVKLEIETAIDRNFWGNPNKPWRPKIDPGKMFDEQRRAFRLSMNRGGAATSGGVMGGPQ